jgi:hypothetical protein
MGTHAPTTFIAFEMRKENLLAEFDASGTAYFFRRSYRRGRRNPRHWGIFPPGHNMVAGD